MAKAWLPNGRLSDGTLLIGPFKVKPIGIEMLEEVTVDGVMWYIGYCCKALTDEQRAELQQWAEKNISKKG